MVAPLGLYHTFLSNCYCFCFLFVNFTLLFQLFFTEWNLKRIMNMWKWQWMRHFWVLVDVVALYDLWNIRGLSPPNYHIYIYIYMCVCVCVCVCERKWFNKYFQPYVIIRRKVFWDSLLGSWRKNRWELTKDGACCFKQILVQHSMKKQLRGNSPPISQLL